MGVFKDFWEWLHRIPWLEFELGGNSILRWTIAAGAMLAVFLAAKIVLGFVVRRIERYSIRSAARWDDAVVQMLRGTRWPFLFIVALFVATLLLALSEHVRRIVESVVIVALVLQAALWGNVLLKFGIEQSMRRRMEADPAAATTISAMSFVGKLVLWSLVVLLALSNLGVDVTALVAGLGVGGIAVALAAQNILGDLFASLSIVLDKPFVLGDFIIVGDLMGTVERIGLKTTRVRSLSGEQLVFSNKDLLSSRVRNFKQMFERRAVFSVAVSYRTPRDKLAAIPGMLRQIVESQQNVRFDRAHFKEMGTYSLNFETVYYVLLPQYHAYMDVQQAINLAIVERFAAEGIEFAYPTQTVFLERAAGGCSA
jgi:small-conductance mechanosensitive channel